MAMDERRFLKPSTMPRGRLVYYIPALIAAIAISLFAVYADWQKARLSDESAKADVTQSLSLVKAQLEGNIRSNTALVQGLANVVAENPDITQEKLGALAKRLLSSAPQIHNLAIAPNMKVSMVFPLAGNEKAIGLDYYKNKAQRDGAVRVKETRQMLIAGPVKLVQGGTGLIARFPVVTGGLGITGHFWGIISAVMDIERIYAESGLLNPDSSIKIAIASRNPGSKRNHLFFGDPVILSMHPVTMHIDLGYDTWILYAVPKNGWPSTLEQSSFRSILLSIAALLLAPLLWAGNLMADRQQHASALQKREDELAEVSHRLELALSSSKIGVWENDISTSELHWDKHMRNLYDIPPEQPSCSYEDWRRALHPDDLEAAERTFNEAITTGNDYSTGFRIIIRDGSVRHIRALGSVYQDAAGHRKIIGVNWDVTEDLKLQEELRVAKAKTEAQNERLEQARIDMEYAAMHDSLTGLGNRRYLDKILQDAPDDRDMTVLHLDLDRFKEINDTFGHAVGDVILNETAKVLRDNVHPDDFIARIGGDEFVVASGANAGNDRDYVKLANSLVEALSRPFLYEGHECRVGASIGLASGNTANEPPTQLLINSDIALYEAKRKGRNRVELFSDRLRQIAINTKRTADDILRALEKDQFVSYYQPQFDAQTLEINGFEALVRWHHPDKGTIYPDQFLRIAENLKVVSEIDGIVLNQANSQFIRMIANGIEIPKFSVNISAQRLKDEAFIESLKHIAFRPGTLAVELLESISFEADDSELVSQIDELKAMGVDIEIDDFGTGRASILTLLKLMPRRLKIDRQLVFPIVTSPKQRALVRSIIDIGRSRDIEIVAEGVETMEHAEILRDLGCHSLQGYAFARPMDGNSFLQFVKDRAWFPQLAKISAHKKSATRK